MRKVKIIKKLSIVAALCVVFALVVTISPVNNLCASAETEGKAEIVMELSQWVVLHQKNATERLPMASTTKIMTALIIVEECNLEEEITVDDSAVGVEGSSIYLKHGEKITVGDLVYGLMMRSGNDSAHALAIHHSGSVNKFVEKMNARAKEIGLNNTNFANPSGLPDEKHYTTAEDLCKLACFAMKNDTFKKIVSTKNYNGKFRSFVNKNKILYNLEGANGVKTGYTIKAGRCLVSSAEREGMDVVCVVLNCPDMYERCENLINWSFDNFKLSDLSEDKVFMCDIVPCKLDKNYKIVVRKNDNLSYEAVKTTSNNKVRKGDIIGKLKIYSQNNLIFCQNLYSIIND